MAVVNSRMKKMTRMPSLTSCKFLLTFLCYTFAHHCNRESSTRETKVVPAEVCAKLAENIEKTAQMSQAAKKSRKTKKIDETDKPKQTVKYVYFQLFFLSH